MRICGIYSYHQVGKNCVEEDYGYITMSVEELYRYLCDDFAENLVLISWLPNIKEIEVLYYEKLKITFHTGEQITLYDENIANYFIECIRKAYKEAQNDLLT